MAKQKLSGEFQNDLARPPVKRQTGVDRHPLAVRKDDFYPTNPAAVRALLSVEKLPHRLWEPFAGDGAIVEPLRAAGHDVVASDLVDYGMPDQHARWDFLMEWRTPPGVEAIVSNCPFKIAQTVVEHALDLCPLVILLLRTLFLEAQGRRELFQRHLSRVHVFSDRIPDMHRDGWTGNRASPRQSLSWYVFERERAQRGSAVIDWILMKEHARAAR